MKEVSLKEANRVQDAFPVGSKEWMTAGHIWNGLRSARGEVKKLKEEVEALKSECDVLEDAINECFYLVDGNRNWDYPGQLVHLVRYLMKSKYKPKGKQKYFVHHGDGDIDLFDSENEAKEAAEKTIQEYGDQCDPEWPEEVNWVYWGVVLEEARERALEGQEPPEGCDYAATYVLCSTAEE
jgi:hypothetical protein